MTHVLYFGVTDFTLQMQNISNETQKLQRIVFPPNKFSNDPSKTSKKGEQELCFINVICSEQNTFLIDTQYDLWGFGNSQFFQLGLQQPSVTQPINISQITKNQYRLVSAGSGFVAAYSTNKKLYIWGNLHQLNYGDVFRHSEKQVQSEQIETYYAITQVDITPNFSIIKHPEQERRSLYQIVHQADVIQLKCVGTTTYLLTPNKLYCLGLQQQFSVQFVGLACGQKHVLGWDESGRAWSWGEFADGKLGYMDFSLKEQPTPRQVEHFQIKIVQCACGSNYSIALDVKGDIYGWGKGPFQMDLSKAVLPMKLCQKQKPFIKIIAGDSHFGALDLFGHLYCWGINYKNCLGDLPERTRFPQLFDLQNLKVIDAAMGNSLTVIIVPANPSYRLPSLNVDQYTSFQQKRVKEEAALMKDFAERKNKIDQIQSLPQTQQLCETPVSFKVNTEYEKTANLLQKMKNQVDSLKGQPKFKQITRSLRLETDVLSCQTQINQDYDDVLQRLKQLEYQNYLYIPVCNNSTPTQQPIETQTEIDQLLSNENDVLKFQYIMMVQEQDETKFMKNLLVDQKRQSIESMSLSQSKVKTPNYRIRDDSKNDRRHYHDKFDTFDPYILQNVKRELQIQSKKRKEIFLKKQKQREELNQEISDKMQMRKVPIQSKEDIMKMIQAQAFERELKLRSVQQKKQEHFVEKMNHLQQQICEKSPEFRYKKRLEIIRVQQNMQMFSMMLTFFNIENVCQIMQETSQRGLELKRMMFKEHMKARIIQNTIRKRNVIKKIKSKLGLRQKKILLSFIFRFKIHFRIKSKYTHIRKINLFHLKNQITQKFRINLVTVTKKVKTIQQFCRWYNHIFYVQLSYLNYKWDEFLKQTFKGQSTEKEREELKQHELHHLMEKQHDLISKLTTPLRSRLQILNDLKFPLQVVMKGTELRTNLLKKIKPIVQIDEEFKDYDSKCAGRVLLPYTKFIENIALSVAAKIRFDYPMMIQMQVHEKVYMEELKVKFEILTEHLERQRKDYMRQMKEFYSKLADCKDSQKQQIFDDKRNKMMKPDTKEYKILKSSDDQDSKIVMQKKEMSRKRNGQNIIYKDIIFNRIRSMPQDQYPFPNFTFKLIENMLSEQKPKFKLRMNLNEWSKLFTHYQIELKQRYLAIMNEARKVAAQRIKNLQQKKIKNKKKRTEQ